MMGSSYLHPTLPYVMGETEEQFRLKLYAFDIFLLGFYYMLEIIQMEG